MNSWPQAFGSDEQSRVSSAGGRRAWSNWRSVRLSPRVRQLLHSLGLGVLLAAISTLSIELSRWHPRFEERVARGVTRPSKRPPSLVHDQRLVPVVPEPAPSKLPDASVSGASSDPKAKASPSASAAVFQSASDLFLAAKAARERGDTEQAILLSLKIEEIFPNSPEGVTSHLSLGILYLTRRQPERALEEFKIYRHIGDPEQMAEALWGEAQALQSLARPADERAVLAELVRNYPRSAYVAAAEQRLAVLP
jgi:tetratricopeptide (TPR) repeat protein